MVFGWLAALALETVSHISGESTITYGTREFNRFIMAYDFAIEGQKLKRDDVRDLVELIVSRMDMYHLVGALLLQFCVSFYGELKLLEEDYADEPCFVLEMFLLSNICAIGFLLFAVWLSLHASVAAHAIGVEFQLDSNRLTVPSPENLRQMRQSTSIFRHIYQMFEAGSRQPGAPHGRFAAIRDDPQNLSNARNSGMLRGPDTTALAVRKFVTEDDFKSDAGESHVSQIGGQGVELDTAGQPGQMPLSLNMAINTMEHRQKFAMSHRCWLRFDAYSRVCMALGINHFLQALSYFIIGPVQQKRPSSSLITLISIQAIALLLLKLDLRNTEAEHDEPKDNEDDSDSSKDGEKLVSQASNRDMLLTLTTYSLAPIWTTLALWANRFTDNKKLLSLSVSPCFFLHAMWLFLVLKTISPNQGDLLPVRLRTVGYLDIFTKDVLMGRRAGAAEQGMPGEDGRGRTGSETDRPLKSTSGLMWGGLKPGEKPHHHHSRSAESVPWLVVSRFIYTLMCMWVCGGIAHFAHTIYPNFEEFSEDLEQELQQELQLEGPDGESRRLRAVWPEPARFFEVTALHCNSSHITFSSPSSLYAAERHGDDGLSLGALVESGSPNAHAVMCREVGGCDALVPKSGGSAIGGQSGGSAIGGQTWQLEPTGPAYYDGASSQTIQLPPEWRMATGAWLPCSPAPCEAALLGGWDGSRIVIADLRRASADDSWSLKRRFAVRPGLQQKQAFIAGPTRFSMATGSVAKCNSTQALDYTAIQAMHISVSSGCQTLMVLHNGTLDGWNLVGGAKLGSWSVQTTAHTAMCHDGQDLIITHPGDQDGPVVETVSLPSALLNCTRSQAIGQDDLDVDLAKLAIAQQAGVQREPL